MPCKKVLIFCYVLLFSFSLFSQNHGGYSINGVIGGLKEGQKVLMFLIEYTPEGGDRPIRKDSTYIENGKFNINGIVPEGPRLYILNFGNDLQLGQAKIKLFIDNGQQLKITIPDINRLPRSFIDDHIYIEGCPTQDSRKLMTPAFTIYDQSIARVNRLARVLKDSIGFSGPSLDGIYASRDEINEALFYNMFYSVDTFYTHANMLLYKEIYDRTHHGAILSAIYNILDERTKNGYYGKFLKELVTLCVGQPFPEFTLPGVDGKLWSLKDVYSGSKLTIVHIWAANSAERSKYQEELRALYKRYHSKGLNVIGLSSDKSADLWKMAVNKNAYPWPNVSELKGKDGIVNTVYHEYGKNPFIRNTTNVVIDRNGKIVAWDVAGIELEWILWKHLAQETN